MDIFVLDESFQTIAVFDEFESLIWTDRYNKCGDFEIYGPATEEMLSVFVADRYLWLKGARNLMIVEDRKIESDEDNHDKITVTGRSLDSILDRRIILGQKVLTGNFQNAINTLLTENVISPTDTTRAIPNFIFEASTDTRITALTIDAQYNFDNLYEAIQKLCEEKNVGFEVVLNGSNQFVFRLYLGTDRSYAQSTNPYVVFSPSYDNLINSSYIESKKTLKTVSIVGGEGEGSARKTATASATSGAGTGLSRREMFVDASDVSSTIDGGTLTDEQYSAQLVEKGSAELANNVATKTFEGKVEATRSWIYGTDYFMGDIVQIVNEQGIESTSRITELIHSQDSTGTSVYPTFSTIT
jgi:hypothetical protein